MGPGLMSGSYLLLPVSAPMPAGYVFVGSFTISLDPDPTKPGKSDAAKIALAVYQKQ